MTVRRVIGHSLTTLEHATISMAVGVLEFGLAMFVLGILQTTTRGWSDPVVLVLVLDNSNHQTPATHNP